MELGSLKRRLRADKTNYKGASKIKRNKVSPELAIDLMKSCLLSGIEQLRKVKIDKICLKIALENCSLLDLVSDTLGDSKKQTLEELERQMSGPEKRREHKY